MMHRKCPICGNSFQTNNGNAKYCSDKCRAIGYKKRTEKFKANNPEYQKEYRLKRKNSNEETL